MAMLNQYFPIEDAAGRMTLQPKASFDILSPWGPVGAVPIRHRLPRRGTSVWLSMVIFPLVLLIQLAGFGGDAALSATVSSLAELIAALTVFLLATPDVRFWVRASPLIVLIAAASAWMTQPLLAPHLLPWRAAAIGAPDLALSSVVHMSGTAALLLGAAALGYRRGSMRSAIDAMLLFGIFEVAVVLFLHHADLTRVSGFDKGIVGTRFSVATLNPNACLFAVLALLGAGRLLAALRDQGVVNPTGSELLAPYLGSLAVAAGIGGCAVTASRTALGAALALLVVLVVGDREVRRQLATRTGKIVMILMATGMLLAFGIFGSLRPEWLDSVRQVAIGHQELWGGGWNVGWSAYAPLRLDEIVEQPIPTFAGLLEAGSIQAIHNEWVTLLFAGGIPLVILICAIGLHIVVAAHRLRRYGDPTIRSALAAVFAILICASVDNTPDVSASVASIAIIGGLIYGKSIRSRRA